MTERLARLETLAMTRRGVVLVAVVALVTHSVLTIVMPVVEGADYPTYSCWERQNCSIETDSLSGSGRENS